jgi:ADP-ribose pyrophosphatase YjhB (NUDIX family)
MEKKFSNRPNPHVINKVYEGNLTVINQDYFLSRSVALVGIVFAVSTEGIHVLITKRSHKMRDEASKCCAPCGYLDWDETAYEAMTREVYEETSFYLPDFKKQLIFDNDKQPFLIKDNPKTDLHQNVSLLYLTVFDFVECMENFPLDVEGFSCKETEWVSWAKLTTVFSPIEFKKKYKTDWAFHHDETIKSALQFYNKNFERK